MPDELYFPAHLLPPERHYRPAASSWLAVLPPFKVLALIFTLVVAYLILNRVALYSPPVLALLTMGIENLVAIVLIIWIAVYSVMKVQDAKRFRREHATALQCLKSGNVGEAGAVYDRLCRDARHSPKYQALFVLKRGLVYLYEGRAERAASLFASAYNSGQLEKPSRDTPGAYGELLCAIALTYAIAGDLERAEFWEGLAHDHAAADAGPVALPMHLVIGIRRGRAAVVLKDAQAEWQKAEALFGPYEMRMLKLLSAFGLSQMKSEPGHEEKMQAWIAEARTGTAGEFNFLGENWPAFREFLRQTVPGSEFRVPS